MGRFWQAFRRGVRQHRAEREAVKLEGEILHDVEIDAYGEAFHHGPTIIAERYELGDVASERVIAEGFAAKAYHPECFEVAVKGCMEGFAERRQV